MIEKKTSGEAAFTILDPRGIKPERKVMPLTAPRLDTLEGKTVYVYAFEGFAQLMPEIAKLLPEFVPGVKVVLWDDSVGSEQGPAVVEGKLVKEIAENADAVIAGNGF